jgi:DNA modification methylase
MKIPINQIMHGDCLENLKELPEKSINMCMTSPPYWALRDYGVEGQLGLEPTFDEYINKLCDIFDEVQRVLRDDGTCWVNIGDSYVSNGSIEQRKDKKVYDSIEKSHKRGVTRAIMNDYPSKCMAMVPFRFAIEMVNRGWILRNTIIWHKRNCMPSSVKDRFTVDFEYLFFFSKNKKYYFETQLEPLAPISMKDRRKDKGRFEYDGKRKGVEGIQNAMCGINSEGRNKRTVWVINPKPFKEAHFAVYPEELCETPIKAGCSEGGIVLDPFFGAGTTGLVALKQDKKFIGIELNPEYIKIAQARLKPHLEQRKLI